MPMSEKKLMHIPRQ